MYIIKSTEQTANKYISAVCNWLSATVPYNPLEQLFWSVVCVSKNALYAFASLYVTCTVCDMHIIDVSNVVAFSHNGNVVSISLPFDFSRETNLKVRQAVPVTAQLYDHVDQLADFNGMPSIISYSHCSTPPPLSVSSCGLCSSGRVHRVRASEQSTPQVCRDFKLQWTAALP